MIARTTLRLPGLTEEEMMKLLEDERVGRLGLNDDPQPYVVPTDFAYKDGIIYIHSAKDGKKSELARRNPYVCFEVDKYNSDVTEYMSVIIRGKIVEVYDDAERSEAMRILGKKAVRSPGWRPHAGNGNLSGLSIFKIYVKEMTGIKSPHGGHP